MTTPKQRVAIIGSGISGLHCAYLLDNDPDNKCEVSVFEKNDYLGGHTDTHEFHVNNEDITVDSGFIVFCEEFYPHFSSMISDLKVETQPTAMSFSAYDQAAEMIYNATSINKLFCQRRNLFNPRFYAMIRAIMRFYRQAPKEINELDKNLSVADYLEQRHYPESFFEWHLAPMIGALWSATPQKVSEYPIVHLVDYMSRHGMMKLFNRPEWKTIKGGSNSYIKALQSKLNAKFLTSHGIAKVKRSKQTVELILESGDSHEFDHVVFACHSQQTLRMLDTPSQAEQDILSAINFQPNAAIIHTDESVMHSNPLSWASWNTYVPSPSADNQAEQLPCTAVYWMNSLQNLECKTNIFVSLNPQNTIEPSKVLKTRHYEHPIFDQAGVNAQKRLAEINGKNRSYFAGAYWGWGFHEDGARSAFDAAELLRSNLKSEAGAAG